MNKIFTKSAPYAMAIAIFIIISTAFFSLQTKGYLLRQNDYDQYLGMSKEIIDFREKYNDEPLWTGAAFAGMPTYQVSSSESTALGKIKNLVLKVMPRPIGYMFFLMFGFYILLLCFNVDPRLAIIGAVAFGLASLNILYLGAGHNAKVHAISFLPPLLGGIIYSYRKNLWVGLVLTSIFTSLNLTSNHIQMTYYFMFLLLSVVIVEFIRFYKNNKLPSFFRISAFLLLAGGIGVLPTISNLMITQEYGKHTTRGKSELTVSVDGNQTGINDKETNDALDPEYIKRYNFSKGEIWSLVFPNVKGGSASLIGNDRELMKEVDPRYRQNIAQMNTYWGEQATSGGAFYMGASIFILFVLGMFFIKDYIKWAILAILLLAILLSRKYGATIDFFIYHFPLFNKFRDTKMILILVQISMPLMAMIFLNKIREGQIEIKKFLYILSGVTGLFLLFYVMPSTWFDFLSSREKEYFNNPSIQTQYSGLVGQLESVRMIIFKKDCLRSLMFVLLTGGVTYLTLIKKITPSVYMILLGLIVIIDLWGVDKRYLNDEKSGSQYIHWVDSYQYYNPFQPTVPDIEILKNEMSANPQMAELINSEVGKVKNDKKLKPKEFEMEKVKVYFRELNLGTNYRVLSLASNLTMSSRSNYFHKSLGGYHGAKLRRIDELIGTWISREYSLLSNVTANLNNADSMVVLPDVDINVLNMLNTKYIIYNLNRPPAYNPYRFGNAWFVKKAEIVENADAEMNGLETIDKEKALIQKKYVDLINVNIEYDSLARIEETLYRPNHLVYKTNAGSEQLAVFSEVYYEDGWNAYIDNKKTEYVKANFLLRAMNIPAGEHTVEFKFEPETYYLSRTLSKAGSALIIIFIAGGLFLAYRESTMRGE